MSDVYAVVVSGVVSNVVLWDGSNEWVPEIGVAIRADDCVAIGWLHDGSTFISPPEPEMSIDELIARAESKRIQLIDDANEHINTHQWAGKAALGILTDDERNEYNLWIKYLDALRMMDTENDTDLTFPRKPN